MNTIQRMFAFGALLPCVFLLSGHDRVAVAQHGPDGASAQPAAKADVGPLPKMTPMKTTGPLSPPAAPARFTFAVCGDSQGENDSPQTRQDGTDHPTLRAICQDIRSGNPKPAFLVSLGDIIRGEPKNLKKDGKLSLATIDAIKANLRYALGLAKLATVPVYNAPGNHEMDDVTNTSPWTEMPNARMHEAYEQTVGPTYGAFEYGNSLFIVLNTEDVPPSSVPAPEGDQEFSYVSKKQIAQLTATLEANTDRDHIFIAMHYPIHARNRSSDELYGASRTELMKLFANKKYPISYVLASHQHLFYDHNDPIDWNDVDNQVENWPGGVKPLPEFTKGDDPRFLISGGAGASLGRPAPYKFHHYILLEVDGLKVNATVHYIPPPK